MDIRTPLSNYEIGRMCADASRINIVCYPLRPGTHVFATRLEFEHYKPDTHRNMLLDVCEVCFEGVMFITLSIPAEDRHLAEQIAEEEQLVLVNGFPVVPRGDEIVRFPVHTPNTYMLQNAGDHPCHAPDFDSDTFEGISAARCKQMWEAHRLWWEALKRGVAS